MKIYFKKNRRRSYSSPFFSFHLRSSLYAESFFIVPLPYKITHLLLLYRFFFGIVICSVFYDRCIFYTMCVLLLFCFVSLSFTLRRRFCWCCCCCRCYCYPLSPPTPQLVCVYCSVQRNVNKFLKIVYESSVWKYTHVVIGFDRFNFAHREENDDSNCFIVVVL